MSKKEIKPIDKEIKPIDKETKPIDKETKVMILNVLKRGYIVKSDFDLLVEKYGYKPDEKQLSGSIPIADWIRWRVKENENLKNENREFKQDGKN